MGLPHAMLIIADADLRRRWDDYLIPFDFHYVTNAFSLAAVTAIASGKGDDWLKEANEYLKENRDIFVSEVKKRNLPIKPLVPEASFLFWIDCRDTNIQPEVLADAFLNRAGICLNNGLEHGEAGRGFVRLNFGVTRTTLCTAIDRIEKMFNNI